MRIPCLWVVGAACISLIGAMSSRAATIFHGSRETSTDKTGVSFEGQFSYMADPLGRQAILRIDVRNTTPTGVGSPGGRLTAIVFNEPNPIIRGIEWSVGSAINPSLFSRDDGLDGSPFGTDFDFGIGFGDDEDTFFSGEDDPGGGIRPGRSRIFVMRLRGFQLDSLRAEDFLGATNPEGGFFLAARFHGIGGAGPETDALFARLGPPPSPIPEPRALVLTALGLAPGLGWALRRFSRKEKRRETPAGGGLS